MLRHVTAVVAYPWHRGYSRKSGRPRLVLYEPCSRDCHAVSLLFHHITAALHFLVHHEAGTMAAYAAQHTPPNTEVLE